MSQNHDVLSRSVSGSAACVGDDNAQFFSYILTHGDEARDNRSALRKVPSLTTSRDCDVETQAATPMHELLCPHSYGGKQMNK